MFKTLQRQIGAPLLCFSKFGTTALIAKARQDSRVKREKPSGDGEPAVLRQICALRCLPGTRAAAEYGVPDETAACLGLISTKCTIVTLIGPTNTIHGVPERTEVWPLTKRMQCMWKATEMDFWRQSARILRRDRVRNEKTRQVKNSDRRFWKQFRRKKQTNS
ncbi:unnamed protein product [Bemisia tabaci]|uniref:Uncharacterized protein n=1 Tax=Bemisia tabaci TaxID=7038 RepID=A0A9P0F1Q3_BEMTA|nr:unnamed protein product [Bemisia tabaci]